MSILDFLTADLHCLDYAEPVNYFINNNCFGYGIFRNGTYLYVITQYEDTTLGEPGACLTCTYNDNMYSFQPLDGWTTLVCRIPYAAEADTQIVFQPTSGNELRRGFYTVKQLEAVFLSCVTPPTFALTTTLYEGYDNVLKWKITPGDGRVGYAYTVFLYLRKPGEADFTQTVVTDKQLITAASVAVGDVPLGTEWYLFIEYRTFDRETWDYQYYNYTTFTQVTTPVQVVSRNATIPLAPTSLTTGTLHAGGKTTVSWSKVQDPLVNVSTYTLQRSLNGTDFIALYRGTSQQYPDNIPAGTKQVWYRVCANSSAGVSSPWLTVGPFEVIVSNLYVGTASGIRQVSAIRVGTENASPLVYIG